MTSLPAKVYIGLMYAAGAAVLGFGLAGWHTQDWARFLFYCAVAGIASGMKVTLTVGTGTMSMSFLFVLIGIADLSLAETLIMGCLGIVVQSVFHARLRPIAVQVLFNVASMACSIGASYGVYRTAAERAPWLETPMILLLAAAAYFLTNTLSVALAISLTEQKSAWKVWRDSYFWTFPNYLVGAAAAWVISSASRVFGWQTALLALPVLYVIYRSHRLYIDRLEEDKRRMEEQRIHAEEMAALHRRTTEALALAIEAKDQTTGDHLARVEIYAMEVGKELGLSADELKALQASSLLHDIGKLAVPEYIISKPGKLTPEEFEKMKIHPVVGAEILEHVRFPFPVTPIVRSHHEKWDGSGYPDGLSGEQIPIGARILSAVDCLDALASDRQYRRALPLDEAIKVVENEAGKSFDPRVVAVLSRRCVELERMAKRVTPVEKMKLSTDVKVERGAAPAAGFETTARESTTDLMNFRSSVATAESQSRVLASLALEFDRCTERPAVFEALQALLRERIPYNVLAFYLREGQNLRPEHLDGAGFELFASLKIPLGMGLSGWVAENGKPVVNGNPSVEPGYLNDPTKFSTLRSALAVPLDSASGVFGVLSLYRQDRDAFTTEDLRLLLSIGAELGRVLSPTVAGI